MRTLFNETTLNGMVLKNRLVRSATWEGMAAPDGRPTARLAAYYATLAKGGVGLIITGYAYIRLDGKQLPGQMGAHSDELCPDLRLLADAVHREGGKLCLQLVHCGGQASTMSAGRQPLAPSAVKVAQFPELPEELTEADILELIRLFGESARRAWECGFDAVQIHAAHGYLINQFLSPLTNRRTDGWGGDTERRSRFLLEAYRSVRANVGPDFPVLVKLNGSDNLPGGLAPEDALSAARELDAEGVDAIEVSSGTPASGDETPVRQHIEIPSREAYNLQLAERVRNAVSCPVMVVGGLRSFDVTEGIIRREEADYAALSRPFIREPDLPRRWQEGDETPARCISCNGCFKPGLKQGGIYCVIDAIEREAREASL
jgi:2,4-dienoyl-CoA reductase-like NADH-dependent reductase (Old Yellow Enzyme family)